MGTIGENLKKFDEANGDYVVFNGWIHYETGAMREKNPWGVLMAPPEDKYKLAKNIVYFCELKLELAKDEFLTLKRQAIARTKIEDHYRTPPANSQVIEELQNLKSKVEHWKKRLADAKKQVKKAKPEWMIQREKIDRVNRQKQQELSEQISNIEI